MAVTMFWLQLLLFYSPPTLGQSCWDAAEDKTGECHISTLTCEKDHQEQILDFCETPRDDFDLINFDYYSCIENDCFGSVQTFDQDAPLDEIEILPIEIHSVSIRSFSINLTWHHSMNFTVGYKISIKKGDSEYYDHPLCICDGRRNFHIFLFDYTSNMNGEDELMTVEIEALTSRSSLNTKQSRVTRWPTSCLDAQFYNSTTCAAPVLDPPQNITALEVCEENQSGYIIVRLSWNYFSSIFAPPSHYYIEASYNETEVLRFIVNGTTEVFLQLPNAVDYRFNVKGYSNCSGGANYTNSFLSFGCGSKSDSFHLTRCPILETPASSVSPTKSTTTTTTTTRGSRFVFYIIGGCLGGVLLLLFILVALVIVYFSMRKQEIPVPLPKPVLPSDEFSVFVMHAPQENSMKSIQTYVVCPLREFFNVATSGDKMSGDMIEWIEVQVRQRSAVLLVFTKEFCSEWEGNDEKSQVVQAAQRLLTSAVAQELLDKYAIIVLDEDAKNNHIPNNHFLKSMSVYMLGKSKNEIENLYRFVTKTKSFEHQETPASKFNSFSSSFDFASYSTDSTDVTTNGTPSSSQQSVPLHGESIGDEDTKNVCCDSKLHKDVRLSQNLLQVLQAPSSPNHAEEFV